MFAAVHGGVDFFISQHRAPVSLDEVIANGNLPYLLSKGASFSWQVLDGKMVQCSSLGAPVYWHGQHVITPKVSFGFPAPGLSQTVPASKGARGQRAKDTKLYNFAAARYLEAVLPLSELNDVLRRQRILLHLAALAVEHGYATGKCPESLADPEAFQGLARNPVARTGVQTLAAGSQVANDGGLRLSASQERLTLSMDVGPEVEEYVVSKDSRGNCEAAGVILFYQQPD